MGFFAGLGLLIAGISINPFLSVLGFVIMVAAAPLLAIVVLDALDVLDGLAVAIAHDALHTGLAAEPLIEGEFEAFLADHPLPRWWAERSRVVLAGDSAGGGLALAVALVAAG